MRKLSAVAQGMNNVGIGWRITERQYLLVETTDGTVVCLFVQSQRKHSIFCSTCPSYCICLLWYLQSRITVKCPFVCFFRAKWEHSSRCTIFLVTELVYRVFCLHITVHAGIATKDVWIKIDIYSVCEKTASSLSLVLKQKVRQREKNVRAVDDEVVFINRTCVAKIITTGFMVKSDFLTA